MGLRTYLKEYYEKLTKKYPFDFIIGSVHNVPFQKRLTNGNPAHIQTLQRKSIFADRTDQEAYRLMMETTLENVKMMDCFQSLGIWDYIVRYGKMREKT